MSPFDAAPPPELLQVSPEIVGKLMVRIPEILADDVFTKLFDILVEDMEKLQEIARDEFGVVRSKDECGRILTRICVFAILAACLQGIEVSHENSKDRPIKPHVDVGTQTRIMFQYIQWRYFGKPFPGTRFPGFSDN